MLPLERNKQTMLILSKLRDKGAPQTSPFPGEQDPEMAGQDVSPMGDVTSGVSPELQGLGRKPAKKKRPAPSPDSSGEEASPPQQVIGGY